MILSLQDTTTATDALRRGGLACDVSLEGRMHPMHHVCPWLPTSYDGKVFGPGFIGSLSFNFGGLGLIQARRGVFTAPLSLDPSATKEGGP